MEGNVENSSFIKTFIKQLKEGILYGLIAGLVSGLIIWGLFVYDIGLKKTLTIYVISDVIGCALVIAVAITLVYAGISSND